MAMMRLLLPGHAFRVLIWCLKSSSKAGASGSFNAATPMSTTHLMKAGPVRPGDPRLGSLLTASSIAEANAVIIGFPFDEGCTRNGGRPGAAGGPAAFRAFFPYLGAVANDELNVDMSSLRVLDGGDAAGATLEEAHRNLREKVRDVIAENQRRQQDPSGKSREVVPIVIGGGNDQSLANGLALMDVYGGDCGVMNIDAHLDVRPLVDGDKIHSGYPFRGLLEDGRLSGSRFVEFACQGEQCGSAHVAYVREKKGHLMWLSSLYTPLGADPDAPGGAAVGVCGGLGGSRTEQAVMRSFEAAMRITGNNSFISFDIDSISGVHCPGVSCPGTRGLSEVDALNLCYLAGLNPQVRLLDLSEMNPAVEGYRTPRLTVFMVYYFLIGLAKRLSQKGVQT